MLRPQRVLRVYMNDHEASRELKRLLHTKDRIGTSRKKHVNRVVLKSLHQFMHAGVPVGTRTFGIAMGQMCQQGLAKGCDEVYALMKQKGVRMDVGIYNMMMKVHSGKSFETVSFFWDILNSSPPLKPDAISHLTFLRAAVAARPPISLTERNIIISNALRAIGTRPKDLLVVYTTIAPCLRPREARALYYKLVDQDIVPDMRFYTAMLRACVEHKDTGLMSFVEKKVETSNLEKDAVYLDTTLRVQSSAVDFKGMMKTLKEFDERRLLPTITTYCTVIDLCRKEADGDMHRPEVQLACMMFERAIHNGFGSYATLFYCILRLHKETGNTVALNASKERAITHDHYSGAVKKLVEEGPLPFPTSYDDFEEVPRE
eukprot:TRINITY_DN37064_c0_g1_i1.p1 TRINITY_DN37064_c0_g1~~TRINITY_DN37064_c0_g1_i1.p1  ORF type:complete len:374 (+),score=86.53 TRINITY_DN37064_c0_g1_i1:73-1194(+)